MYRPSRELRECVREAFRDNDSPFLLTTRHTFAFSVMRELREYLQILHPHNFERFSNDEKPKFGVNNSNLVSGGNILASHPLLAQPILQMYPYISIHADSIFANSVILMCFDQDDMRPRNV